MSDPSDPPRLGIPELATSVAAVFVSLSLCAWPLWIGPSFARMFEDFEARLPTLTMVALTPWTTVVITCLLLLGVGAALLPPKRAVRLGLGAAIFVLACVTHVAFLFGMYLPIFQVADAIQ